MLEFVHDKNPIQRINPDIQARLIKAQQSAVERVFANAGELFKKIADDLKIAVNPPAGFSSRSAVAFTDLPLKNLLGEINPILAAAGVPESARPLQAVNFAYRVQLVRAFDDPDAMAAIIVETFKTRADAAGAGFLEVILRDSVGVAAADQDSRTFIRGARRPLPKFPAS